MSFRTIGPFLALAFGLTWGIAALLILFTDQIEAIFGELSSTHHPVERWVMGSITLVTVALIAVVTFAPDQAPDRTEVATSREEPA